MNAGIPWNDKPEPEGGTQRAYAEIKKKLAAGQLGPGQVISENGLAEDLGLSRTPIRAALAILSKEGIVEQIPRFGSRIRVTPPEEIKEIFALRYVIESFVACELSRQPVEDRKAKVAELRRILAKAKNCAERAASTSTKNNLSDKRKAEEDFLEWDMNFHLGIAQLAGYNLSAEILRSFRYKVLIYHVSRSPTLKNMETILGEHQDILQAIDDVRKPREIKAVIYTHLLKIIRRWFPDFERYMENLKDRL